MSRMITWCGWWFVAAPLAVAAEPLSLTITTNETFFGWEHPEVLAGGDCRLVVVPAIGGRVMFLAINGENLIYTEPESGGKTLASVGGAFNVGGYQCELGPETKGWPAPPTFSLGPAQVSRPRPNTLVVQGAADASVGWQLEKEIVMAPDSGDIGLQQRLKNTGNAAASACLWDRTACRGGGYLLVPLAKKSVYPAGYALRLTPDTAFASAKTKGADPRTKVIDGVLVVEAHGEALQLGADSDGGWMAYTVGRALLIKYFPTVARDAYGSPGHTVQASVDGNHIDFGPLSSATRLAPGESLVLPEKWLLMDLDEPVHSVVEARALVKRLPPSPFKRTTKAAK